MADKHFLDYDGLSKFFNGLKQKFYQKPSSGIPKSDLALSVRNEISGKLDKSGGTMTGAISMGTTSATRKNITMLADPTEDYDAVNKKYVDDAIEDIELTGSVVRYDVVQSISEADKARARQNIGAGTYTKPANGVPKTDLASDVQTSLDKADKAVRYDVQSLTDGQKAQARGNIGAYAKPLLGIPESDLSYAVKQKLNKTNIITIESEDADPLYPRVTSKTLDEIKDEFDTNLSEQFMVHDNIAYKLEKIITEDNVEKAIFYSVPQIVDNKLHYFSCEIFDTPFNYSTAEFHTYIWAGSGGLIDSVNGQTGAVVLDGEDIEVGRDYTYGGPTNIDIAINDIYQRLGSETHDVFWVSFTRNPIDLDFWNADDSVEFILDRYALGYMIKGKVYLELGSPNYVIVDYRGKVRIGNKTKLVFSGIEGENVISILMYEQGDERPDEVEVSIEPYYQDLTPYRTAAAQDIIDNGKQDVIADLATIRRGAERGATALQSVPATYRTADEQDALDALKQRKLTAGANITIDQSTNNISAVVPVKSVNDEIGSIYLDATNLKTTISQPGTSVPHEVEIYWDAFGDFGDMIVDGVTATRMNLNEAFGDGAKVNVNITFDGATLLANPIMYGVVSGLLLIQCYVSYDGYGDGTPVQFWLDVGNNLRSQSGSTLNNPMPLPAGSVYTINDYLIALEARVAALENS